LILNPGHQQQERGRDLAEAKEGDEGAFVTPAGHDRGDEQGDQGSERDEGEEDTDLGVGEIQLGQE
jgi:hypothetical protein